MPGEVDDSADGADEAEQAPRYARCKPLAPVDSARWHAGEPSRLGRIFYGNDNFFIFFRLHQHLCDRHAPISECLPCCVTTEGQTHTALWVRAWNRHCGILSVVIRPGVA